MTSSEKVTTPLPQQGGVGGESAGGESQFYRFLWSSILIALSACLGNVVDSIIVGNLIGEDGVSAINLSKPITQFMFTISMRLSTGAGMLVGMELGKKDFDRAAYIFTLSTVGCLAFGLLETVCGLFFTDTITGWLCNSEQLFGATRDYLYPLLLGAPTYMDGGVRPAAPETYLPAFVCRSIRSALTAFDAKIKGFAHPAAILTGAETRTSAPVRIPRDAATRTVPGFPNLYPAGEGAGYAGGITSAAIDGIRTAMSLIGRYAPISAG